MGKIDQELNRKLQNHFQNFKKEIDNIVSSELNKCMNKKTRFNKNEYIDTLSATTVDVNAGFITRPKTQSNISEYYEVPIVKNDGNSIEEIDLEMIQNISEPTHSELYGAKSNDMPYSLPPPTLFIPPPFYDNYNESPPGMNMFSEREIQKAYRSTAKRNRQHQKCYSYDVDECRENKQYCKVVSGKCYSLLDRPEQNIRLDTNENNRRNKNNGNNRNNRNNNMITCSRLCNIRFPGSSPKSNTSQLPTCSIDSRNNNIVCSAVLCEKNGEERMIRKKNKCILN